MKAKLTVAIPTWNRPVQLRRTLEVLLPQLSDDCYLLILDNASDIPAESVVAELANGLIPESIRIIRNRVNIGGDANILRCVELCDSEWVWLLGDDDIPVPECVSIIISCINKNSDACFLNFSGGPADRSRVVRGYGSEAFVQSIDYLCLAIWMSTCVFKTRVAQSALRFAYSKQCSCPTFVLAFYSLGTTGLFCLLPNYIIFYSTPSEWSKLAFLYNASSILSIPILSTSRVLLANKMMQLTPFRRPLHLFYLLTAQFGYDDYPTSLYYYDQIYYRLTWHRMGLRMRFWSIFVRLILLYPRIFYFLLSTYRRFRNRKTIDLSTVPLDNRL